MAHGGFDDAQNVFTEAFESAKCCYHRVCAKFYLGQIYLHNNDTSRAKEAFDYVVNHGNKLHIVEEAKEYLKNIK